MLNTQCQNVQEMLPVNGESLSTKSTITPKQLVLKLANTQTALAVYYLHVTTANVPKNTSTTVFSHGIHVSHTKVFSLISTNSHLPALATSQHNSIHILQSRFSFNYLILIFLSHHNFHLNPFLYLMILFNEFG